MEPPNSSDPDYWETRYREGDHPWDKGRAHPALENWLARHSWRSSSQAGLSDWSVGVPGCGLGNDVRALARVFREVVGMDASVSAIEKAGNLPRSGAESYEVASVFAPQLHLRGRFDLVVEHTLLCAILPEDRPRYAEGIRALLKPEGYFLAIFYREPNHEPPGPPFGISADEIDRLFGEDFRLIEAWRPEETFEGREHREEVRLYFRQAAGSSFQTISTAFTTEISNIKSIPLP